jgi:hypothetical membrane protein
MTCEIVRTTKLRFEYLGIAGTALIAICCLITAIGFKGYLDEGYSILNHFISELGMHTESPLAWVFNAGLLVGSPLILIFLLSSYQHLPSKLSWVARVLGIATGVGGFFVGVFPADVNLGAHTVSAMIFFFGGAVTVAIFSIDIFLQKEQKLGRWLCVAGAIVSACFVVFLVVTFSGPRMTGMANLGASIASERPSPFWDLAFLEWLPLIGILAWIFLLAVEFLRLGKQK